MRISNFDFLRGFFVFLALSQHFGGYLNGWYIWQVDTSGTAFLSQFNQQYVGTRLSVDNFGIFLNWLFAPWVSHIYLAMAAFNLGKRSSSEFRKVYKKKLLIYASLFVFFILENAIVAQSRGELFSLYPLATWMIVLSLLTLLYRFCGVRGIAVLYIVSLFHTFSGLEDSIDSVEKYFQAHFHSFFEYDSRIHFFLPSALLGFLLGYLHFQLNFFARFPRQVFTLSLGMALYLFWFAFGEQFPVRADNVFFYEHFFDRSFTGNCFIQGVQILVLTAFLTLEIRGIMVPRNFFHWVGVYSLAVFGLHRIFFLKLIGPIKEAIGGLFYIPMTASTAEIFLYCFISVALTAGVLKLPIWFMFNPRKEERSNSLKIF